MIRQPPLFPQQNRPLPCRTRQRPQRGRVGVGFACIPAGQCSPPKTLPICRQAPTRVISTTSTPESVNPTPALPRGGRESISGKTGDRSRIPPLGGRFYDSGKIANATPALPHRGRVPIGGNWGDRCCIPPLSGRFCDCGKMANATPTPALPRCGRWRVLQGRGRIDCGIGNGCLLFRRTAPSLAGRSPQRAGSHAKCVHILRGARGRGGVGVRHVCSVNLSPIHAPICPLPLWGRDGVGFSDAASVSFRPSVCQNHHYRYRACFFTHLQGFSAMSPVADDKPTPHPATINPTPALRRVPRKMRPHFSWVPAHRGREPIGGKTGDRSRIPPLGGRFYGSGKMANATPSPCGGGMGWGSAMLPRCFSVHPSSKIIITGIAPAFSPIYKAFLQYAFLQIANPHRIRQQLTPPPPSPVGGRGFFRCCSGFRCPKHNGQHPHPN